MSLTSSSTRVEALAQYNDNLTWEGNATKAGLALEAVRWLLVNRPTKVSRGNRSADYESLLAEKSKLESFIEVSGNSVNRSQFVRGVPVR